VGHYLTEFHGKFDSILTDSFDWWRAQPIPTYI
jgi:hypothetical protein